MPAIGRHVIFAALFTAAILPLKVHAAAPVAAPIKVAIVSRTVFYVPLWIAVQRGFLQDEGIDAAIEVFDNAETINERLHSGAIQISVSTPESVIVDAYKGGTLRVIAGNAKKLPHFIIAKPEIRTLAQLRGANFGVLSMQEGTTYLVNEVAKAAGLAPGDYTVTAVGGAPTRWKLLQEGKIDAGLQPFPLSYEAEAAGFTNLGPVASYVPDWQFTSINADDAWARRNQKTVIAFLRALRRGHEYMMSHPDEAARIAADELRTDVALARRALADTDRLGILDPNLALSEPGLARVFASLQAAGLIAAGQGFESAKFVDPVYFRQSQDPAIRDLGSFFVGGEQTELSGMPTREVKYAQDAPPLKLDPNGTYQNGQIYVEYFRLAHPRSPVPILFLNGGTSTGAMWQTTPDGRPGWQNYFLHDGYNTYLTDAVGKGRASWARFPEIFKVEPAFRPNEGTWTLLRMGTHYEKDPARRKAFPGVQFPVEQFDEFAKQNVPRFAGQDDIELKAYEMLVARICPCIVIAQSSGAYFATQLAAKHPDLIKAIAAVEMTAAPDLAKIDVAALAKVPQLLLWGDNQQEFASWRQIREGVDKYATAFAEKGGHIDVIDLPKRGITGNTHQMMMDRNNEVIADIVSDWLGAR
jgi:NitT/TauT family transport system substrate-binding protein